MDNPTLLLENYIRARYPIIVILSHEESRVMDEITKISRDRKARLVRWTCTHGLVEQNRDGERDLSDTKDLYVALNNVFENNKKNDQPASLYVFHDVHNMFDPQVIRLLRDIAVQFETTRDNIILLSPLMQIPQDLEKTVALIDWPLPNADELAALLEKSEIDLPKDIPVTLNGSRERVVQSLQGLTSFEASSVILSAVVATRELGVSAIPHIVKEKAQIIRKSGVLEFFDTNVSMTNVGGLKHLKHYAAINRSAFSAKAREAGVDIPKGVLLLGPAGTGKSLSAKAIAGGELPLLRMDIGALMGGLVGQSEQNMRSALKVAEAVAPCVLWVDEIEKGLGQGDLDGGTSARVFGTLLTWMQETTAPVYVVATANNAESIKPELIRRFDDIFFVDLPNVTSRREIFSIHLAKRKQSISLITDELLEKTRGYSGYEIEKVVKSAVKAAFVEETELTPKMLLEHAGYIIPVSKTSSEQINQLREWVRDRARLADDSFEDDTVRRNSVGTRKAEL